MALASAQRFAPNVPAVAYEAFDDEVVLIHFPSGRYFRLDAVGRAAWACLARPGGASSESVAAMLQQAFDAPAEMILSATETFVSQLLDNDLVLKAGVSMDGEEPASRPPQAAKARFEPPRLEVFTDLEDILLIDPIHDVGESGWPHARA